MTEEQLYIHLMAKALMGETAEHLRRAHAIEPADDKSENTARHMEVHGLSRNARWSAASSQFVPPVASAGRNR